MLVGMSDEFHRIPPHATSAAMGLRNGLNGSSAATKHEPAFRSLPTTIAITLSTSTEECPLSVAYDSCKTDPRSQSHHYSLVVDLGRS